MFKLENVSKTYISKGKQKVSALKDINLEINGSGIVFILGKSGSGKSTLLNILGGLAGATSGEISVDNQSFADFKQADYDNYRNRYVGFVFQEFNLLNDFDVSGNVALALRLSGETDISAKVTSALQAVGLSAEYLTRKIDELSGGEKQRIAIARALVKESRVILADEPTGNLDSATGESIWNILKEFSKTKLVVVVTHDRESAEKYGDRIIEISDGKIVSDSGVQPAGQGEARAFATKRKSLSNAVCFKMGVNNLLQRKVKSLSVIMLSVFTIFAVLLTQLLLCFSSEKACAKFIAQNNIDYITVAQSKVLYGNELKTTFLKPSTLKYIQKNSNYIIGDVVEKKQDVLDMGLSFVGDALELDDKSFYLTTSGLEKAYKSKNSYLEIDGESVKLIKERHPAEFLTGKKLNTGSFSSMGYTVAGVIDITECNPLIGYIFSDYFAKESFGGRTVTPFQLNSDENNPQVLFQFGEARYAKEFKCENNLSELNSASRGGSRILTERGMLNLDEVTLADDEIVLNYEVYAEMFGVGSQWSYVSTDLTQIIKVPEYLGQSIPVKFFDYDSGEMLFDAGNLKLAGVVFSYTEYVKNPYYFHSDDTPRFSVGANTAKKINSELSPKKVLIQISSINNLQKFLYGLRNKYDGVVLATGADESIDYTSFIYGFEHEIYFFKFIFLIIAVLLSLILLLLVINLISFSILNRKKEIGILSALGAKNRDITKIFLIETLLISGITFIINFAAIFTVVAVFNNIFSYGILLKVPLLRFDLISVVTLIATSFGLLLLAAIIPLRKIIRLKPIDAIKNL